MAESTTDTTTAPPIPKPTWRRKNAGVSMVIEIIGSFIGLFAAFCISLVGMDSIYAVCADTPLDFVRIQRVFGQVIPYFPLLMLIPLFAYVLTFLHESGHLVMGLLVGFRFESITLGPITVAREARGLRLRWHGQAPIHDGITRFDPTGKRLLRFRWALLMLSGPLVSLLILAKATVLVVTNAISWFTADATIILFLRIDCAYIMWVALLDLVSSWRPQWDTQRHPQNDGAKFLLAVQHGRQLQANILKLRINTLLASKARPRDWPSAPVKQIRALAPRAPAPVMADMVLYMWALDKREISLARSALERICQQHSAFLAATPAVALEAAYFYARYDHAVERARHFLAAGQTAEDEAIMRARAEAAISLAEGRYQEAITAANAGLAAIAQADLPLSSGLRANAEDLGEMAAEAQQQANQ